MLATPEAGMQRSSLFLKRHPAASIDSKINNGKLELEFKLLRKRLESQIIFTNNFARNCGTQRSAEDKVVADRPNFALLSEQKC